MNNDLLNDSNMDPIESECMCRHNTVLRGSCQVCLAYISLPRNMRSEMEIKTFRSANLRDAVREQWISTSFQVFIPFLLAGVGSTFAGCLFDIVKNWPIFVNIPGLVILVPPLIGLNGNLEQTLVARLSTQANLGNLNRLSDQIPMITANIALLQCQSTVCTLVACVLAITKGILFSDTFLLSDATLVCADALMAVNLASLILSTLMSAVVILSKKCNKNPDNIAPAIAASFGDLTTLGILAWMGSALLDLKENSVAVPAVITICILLLPVWISLARRNHVTHRVLRSGWIPILSALVISSFGGYILDFAVVRFSGIALHLSPVNALGGNLAAIYVCSLSTYLNRESNPGLLPAAERTVFISPVKVWFGNKDTVTIARILIIIVIPGQIIFAVLAKMIRYGFASMSLLFLCLYILASLCQVAILLYLTRILVFWLWKKKIDPDNAAIPFLTGAGDFTGTGFLTLAFLILEMAGNPVALSET